MCSRFLPKLCGSLMLPFESALALAASLSEEPRELGDQRLVEAEALTRDSAHGAVHEVASVPSHVSSKAVAD